jgi:protein TonB
VEHRIEEPKPPAPPPPEPPRPSVITQPDWAKRPTGEDMSKYYPERASRMSIEGSATISCTVNARGTLENCSVTAETPAEAGFGDATLKLSKLFKMRPMSKDGAPVDGGTVRIPVRWVLPKG